MAFRRLPSSFGINAPGVGTVAGNPVARPGEQLHCAVTVRGGGADAEVGRMRGRRVAPSRQETGLSSPGSAGRGRSESEAVFVARQDAVDLPRGGCPPATRTRTGRGGPPRWTRTSRRTGRGRPQPP
ncbi:sporulation protein [Streptomyces sp. Wb2n-11]|uniref:sporulation protein n=1 Tax=Streptomyces sp. Wb2n-11 TaxID=1030533 RepID=UPI000A9D5D0A|nr:sporulation protein [Streptomyces sp. Wb2n-11]